MSSSSSSPSSSLTISIKSLVHDTISVTIPRTYSVVELKSKLQSLFYIDRNRQRLLFRGKILKDERKLIDYDNLENDKMIHLVITAEDNETEEPRINTIITLEPHLTTEQNIFSAPTLLEMRLSRTLSYITNIRNMLQIPLDQLELNGQLHMLPSSLRSMHQTHMLLRQNTSSPNEQISLVMDQTADLLELTCPRLIEMANICNENDIIENVHLPIVLRTARMLQIMSLICCFLGSTLDLTEQTSSNQEPRKKKQKVNHC